MPVGSATGHESKEIGERLQPLHVLAGVARMLNLDSVESGRHERLQTLPAPTVLRVRPDCNRAGLVRDRNRIADGERIFGHERAPIGAEVPHECLTEVWDDAARNQGARYVWPADGAAVRLLKNFIERERNSERVQLLHDFLCSDVARRPKLRQSLLQNVKVGEVEREQMYFAVIVECAQLYPGNQTDARPVCRQSGRADAVYRVVISERQRHQPAALGRLDYALGREKAVRGGRVGMQVDERRPARLCAHRA